MAPVTAVAFMAPYVVSADASGQLRVSVPTDSMGKERRPAASSGGFTVAFVYCSEAYPTRVRNVAVAFCNSFARLAAIVAPLVGQLLLDDVSSLGTFGTFGFFGLVATLAALRLPFETLGRDADLCARAAGGGGDLEDHESTKLINPLW
jgi:MFS family permease